MEVAVSTARDVLPDLVRRAAHGEDVVLTQDGQAVARLVAMSTRDRAAQRAALLRGNADSGRAHALPGPDSARSQDFLYDNNGLPR